MELHQSPSQQQLTCAGSCAVFEGTGGYMLNKNSIELIMVNIYIQLKIGDFRIITIGIE
ncbi:hypothetical protein SAMN04488034_103101 [Salinimicrobium catena]|uniref:Uncharacterized protein n=1 Tax=Salinimicrobium catena TaxID=390640 RepID=A0A1H5MU55_9FLAO|nr:hypothetical protein SAMN04488140_103101 [Salinimicrobium catena]SEE92690.1 hypothetical protein SAMN04488034_103101 [Salinimicrobium catena]